MRFKEITVWLLLIVAFSGCRKEDNILNSYELHFTVPATPDIVMYEVNFRAFSPTEDFQGVVDRLDSIKALGINTIWLMPTYPIGIVNSFGSPYCIRDYLGVNPDLGTLEELKYLVQEAHERKMAVILDWVANHTSWDHPWISNPDWYTQDINGNIISPPGTTWNDVADLNFNNDDMRFAMISAMKYWITAANIDGYRCDAADYVPFDFWKQAIDSLKTIPGRQLILLAEGARPDHFTAGFQMNFSWDFLNTLKNVFNNGHSAGMLFTTNTSEYIPVPPGARKLRFTTNHDESNNATPVGVFGGKEGALAASVAAIYLQGVPLIYCGQEAGVSSPSVYTNGTISWSSNPDMLFAYKQLLGFYNSSDAARTGSLVTFNDNHLSIFQKTDGTDTVLVIVNTRSVSETVAIPAELSGKWFNAFTDVLFILSDTVTFDPYGYMILKK